MRGPGKPSPHLTSRTLHASKTAMAAVKDATLEVCGPCCVLSASGIGPCMRCQRSKHLQQGVHFSCHP